MMKLPYFDRVAQKAKSYWEKVESDENISAPIRLFFEQIQSPRHVLSELLQNADDAGATEVETRVTETTFSFSHNGEDFSAKQFESLCSFGISSKSNLHTIGFRGVGFKSIFSLGEAIEVATPSLGFLFLKRRFTLPQWTGKLSSDGWTRFQVKFSDGYRKKELSRNLEKWVESPVSVLFFRNIRRLRINNHLVEKESQISKRPYAEGITLRSSTNRRFILVRSDEEAFPADCVDEIRRTRQAANDTAIPPCTVEVVLEAGVGEGRIFVVLPADVRLDVGLSFNAPFIQDPARTRILSPEESPTNRWLLKRIGRTLFRYLRDEVGDETQSIEDRVRAYDFLPERIESNDELAESCLNVVFEAIEEETEKSPGLVLTLTEELCEVGTAHGLPKKIHRVWEEEQLRAIFHRSEIEYFAHPAIRLRGMEALESWGWVGSISDEEVFEQLRRCNRIPAPPGPEAVAELWSWALHYFRESYFLKASELKSTPLVPIQGSRILHVASEVVRLPRQWAQMPEELAASLRSWLTPICPDTVGTIDEKVRVKDPSSIWDEATEFLQNVELNRPTNLDRVVGLASEALKSREEPEQWVKLAFIAAILDQRVPEDFRYKNRAGGLISAAKGLVVPSRLIKEDGLPEAYLSSHFIDDDYFIFGEADQCEKIRGWLNSEKSRLHRAVPVFQLARALSSRNELRRRVEELGGELEENFRYQREDYELIDWDFPGEVVRGLLNQQSNQPDRWHALLRPYLEIGLPSRDCLKVSAVERGNTKRNPLTFQKPAIPTWIRRLQKQPCLLDDRGNLAQPCDLFSQNPDTDPLRDIERFVRLEDDNERSRPLLRALGVRLKADSVESLLKRIKDVSSMRNPLDRIDNFIRLFEALNRSVMRASPNQLAVVVQFFNRTAAILSVDGDWCRREEVYMVSDEEVLPGAAVLHPRFRELPMWNRIGVPDRPSRDQIRAWLEGLETGKALSDAEYKRLRRILQQFPRFVTDDAQHWVSLNRVWQKLGDFKYRFSLSDGVAWSDLDAATQKRVANVEMLDQETLNGLDPLSRLQPLSAALSYEVESFQTGGASPECPPWLQTLPRWLMRVKLSVGGEQQTHANRCARLLNAHLQPVTNLVLYPRIGGQPAGAPKSRRLAWCGNRIFVPKQPLPRYLGELAKELARYFSDEVAPAIRDCLGRDAGFIEEYFEGSGFSFLEKPLAPEKPEEAPQDESVEDPDQVPVAPDEEAEILESEEQDETVEKPFEEPEEGIAANTSPDSSSPPAPKTPQAPQRQPSLVERFARARGFRSDPGGRCFRNGQEVIEKDEGAGWWKWSRPGGIHRLWTDDQDLSRLNFTIPYEAFAQVEQRADRIHFLLRWDRDLAYLTGAELRQWMAENLITVFPAEYRLRLEGEGKTVRNHTRIRT